MSIEVEREVGIETEKKRGKEKLKESVDASIEGEGKPRESVLVNHTNHTVQGQDHP